MRVLHVITGLGVGGAETQLRLLVRHLPAECEVVTLTDPGPLADAIRADGVPVTHLGMSGNRDLSALPRLAGLIRSRRPDVVHTHLYRACVYGRPAARLAGVRTVVATEHSLGVTQIEGRSLGAATRALYRATERLGSGTLAVSETVAHRLAAWGVPAERVVVAPNGIDPGPFRFSAQVRARTRAHLGIPQDAYVVGGVGRQVRGKNFADLIRAVAAAGTDVHLLLAGDGPERVPLLRVVHSLGVAHRVHLTGPGAEPGAYSPDVPELLAAMDLFVSPSAEESFGVAVVEALAAGLPVLYVNCPALEDLPPLDAPGARQVARYEIAAAVRREFLAGPRRLPVPAAVEHYHIRRTAQAVMALYAAATGTPVPAGAPGAGPRVRPAADAAVPVTVAGSVPGQLVPGRPEGPRTPAAGTTGAGPEGATAADSRDAGAARPAARAAVPAPGGAQDANAEADPAPDAAGADATPAPVSTVPAPGSPHDKAAEPATARADTPHVPAATPGPEAAHPDHTAPDAAPADTTPDTPRTGPRPDPVPAVPAPGSPHDAHPAPPSGDTGPGAAHPHVPGPGPGPEATPPNDPAPEGAPADATPAPVPSVPAPGSPHDKAAEPATARADTPHVPAPTPGSEAAHPDHTAPDAAPADGGSGGSSAADPSGSPAQPPAGSAPHAENR